MSISNVTLDITEFDEHMMNIYNELEARYKYVKDAKLAKKDFYTLLAELGYDNQKQQRDIMLQMFKETCMNRIYILGLAERGEGTVAETTVADDEEQEQDEDDDEVESVPRIRKARSMMLALRQMKAAINVLETFTTEEIQTLTSDDFNSIRRGLRHAYRSIKSASKNQDVYD